MVAQHRACDNALQYHQTVSVHEVCHSIDDFLLVFIYTCNGAIESESCVINNVNDLPVWLCREEA